MASRQQIKGRIKSVKNTKQITKAMELVAASRMRRAQELASRTRRYAGLASELLTSLRTRVQLGQHPLFTVRPVQARLLILITSDRGLAGAYNSNVLRLYVQELQKDVAAGVKNYTIAIGRKGANLTARLDEAEVVGVYSELPHQPQTSDLQPVVAAALELFRDGRVDAVDVLYTHYHNSVNQQATVRHLLPAGFTETAVTDAVHEADFEPSAEQVLDSATLRLIEVQMLQALLEANASEHSMRMMAMKSATDNATDLADDLTLAYNNARQAAITQELAEISGGTEALNAD